MRIFASYGVFARVLIAAFATIGLVGCATGGGAGFGLFGAGEKLTPQAQHVLDHAPKVAPVSRELTKTVPPSYVLEPGDTVLVEAVRFDSPLRFSADQMIQPDGTIDLGRYGRMVVAGKRIEEIEACVEDLVNDDPEIRRALEEADLAGIERVNVRLIDAQGSTFYVLGAVNSPGAYPYTGRETVLDAILAAGDLADNARRCEIVLARPSPVGECRTVLPVCWDNIVQLGDTTTNYQIMPGDRIFIPANGLCDQIFGVFKCKDCPRCCYPQHPAGFASVKCPYPNCYDLGCPPYAGACPPGLFPAPATSTDGPPPAPSGPTVAPPAVPEAEPEFDTTSPPIPVSMLRHRGAR